jgi:hypothetical protein
MHLRSIRKRLTPLLCALLLHACAGSGAGDTADGPAAHVDDNALRASLIRETMPESLKAAIREAPVLQASERTQDDATPADNTTFLRVQTGCDTNTRADALAVAVGDLSTGKVSALFKLTDVPSCSSKHFILRGAPHADNVNAMIVGVAPGVQVHLDNVFVQGRTSYSCSFKRRVDGTAGAFTSCNAPYNGSMSRL